VPKRDADGKFTAKVTYTPKIEAYIKFVGGGIRDALDIIGYEIENEIMDSFPATGQRRSPKTGRMMKGKKPSKLGKPPAVQSGDLKRSVGHDVVYRAGAGKDEILLRVGTQPIKYAIAHELGVGPAYKGGGNRAFISPVVNEWIDSGSLENELFDFLAELMKD